MYREQTLASNLANWYEFNEDDRRILKLSWSVVADGDRHEMTNLGVSIYTMIFNQCPEAKLLFPFMKFDGKEAQTSGFRFQALRFTQVLESAINNLDRLSSLDVILDNLGRRHGRLESSTGFRKAYWFVFLECAICKLRYLMEKPHKKRAAHMTADEIDHAVIMWRLLLQDVIARIEHGYDVDLANRVHSQENSETVSEAPTERSRAPNLSAYSRSSSNVILKSDSSMSFTDKLANFNPFKNRKNSTMDSKK